MRDYNEFLEELLNEDTSLKKEIELLDLRYALIEELVNYRSKNNISQSEFAERIGVKQQVISRFEKGDVDPRLSFISKIIYGMNKRFTLVERDYFATAEVIEFKERKKITMDSYNYKLVDLNRAV